MSEPSPIQKSLETFFANLGAPPIQVVASLSDKWEDIMGPALSKVTEPVSVKNGVLEISCTDPAFIAQIKWMETQIIEAYEAQFAPNKLSAVKARLSAK